MTHLSTTRSPTIGFICTWPVYQGTTIDRYAYSLIQGISAAAHDLGCNLLLGCGFSATGSHPQNKRFWPVAGPGVDFVPVGPWNTDGLIIVPDELTRDQSQYVRDLLASGFPIIFTTPEGPGPVVTVDNTLGIRQAFTHLYDHGHRQIAFLAGNSGQGGDSEERLRAYQTALREANLPPDPRLIAYGEHRKDGGAAAMQQIIDSGAPFTALIASNDLSCLGAIQQLDSIGRRIPEDVAVIGFDDILDARSLTPSLTTIRHPTFSLGYQSVATIARHLRGEQKISARVVVSPRLIVRQSCGCRPASLNTAPAPVPLELQPVIQLHNIARRMAEASLIEARNSLLEDLEAHCASFLTALVASMTGQNESILMDELNNILAWTDERGEDVHVWQAGTAILYQQLNVLHSLAPTANPQFAASLLDRVRLEISDQIQRQTTRSMLEHMDMMSQLGLMTAELLAAVNVSESAEILTRHLPNVGVKNVLVALYDTDREDPASEAVVLFAAGLPGDSNGLRFEPRKFPVPHIYPAAETLQLTILPLEVDEKSSGFVAFTAPNPELCAAIVYNLSAALRTSHLINDAVEGRRLAEAANRLKSRFLSMVSHELRTPLSLIVGLSEMVLREQREQLLPSKTQSRDVEQINTSAQHLARLIGDVLDLASSEAGQLRILHEPLDLAEVLRVTAKIGEELAREKGLAWQANLPAHGPWVVGDRTRLRQVTLNLISNAVKFTAAGQVRLDVDTQQNEVVVSVSDTGIGIAPDQQVKVFDEFYRPDSTFEAGYGGLGLGLAITRQLVERHGGRLNVRSPGALGSGSTFSFYLPVAHSPAIHSPLAAALSDSSDVVMMLVGPDETAEALLSYLQGRAFNVRICRVGASNDWLSEVAAVAPVAIILGERLAVSQGWAMMGALKRQPSTEAIPVLAYSLDAEHNQGELLELNYLHKPLTLPQLTKELERRLTPLDRPQTVLVVDDDPGILDMHRRLIEQTGRRVLGARNGREALETLEHTQPDLILLDLMMPEVDGFAVMDALRTRETTRNIPVIVLTARALSDADLERCNQGVAAILGKGLFSAEETLNHIDAALARQPALGKATQHLIRQAMAYIHAHYAEPVTRETIADAVGISADYLTDCFRQELGVTPSIYIRRYRIRQACELLRSTGDAITQIAMAVGFSDSAHFTRTFQREMGLTPRAYRQSER